MTGIACSTYKAKEFYITPDGMSSIQSPGTSNNSTGDTDQSSRLQEGEQYRLASSMVITGKWKSDWVDGLKNFNRDGKKEESLICMFLSQRFR